MPDPLLSNRSWGWATTALLVLSVLAFADAIFNYFDANNGIHGSEGALLVIASTFLMVVAGALIGSGWLRGGWRGLFEVLLFLDFAGTAIAAYFLEAWLLLALVGLAFIAWLFHFARRSAPSLTPASVR